MSTVDLVLLGMLAEKPQSAYDIQKNIQYRNLGDWVKVGKATVFKNIVTLEKKGYLTSKAAKQGNMPPKTIYTITGEGRAYMLELMDETVNNPVALLFPFNAVVANLNKIPRAEALALLRSLWENIQAQREYVAAMQPERAQIPLVGRTIMGQQVAVYDALLAWVESFYTEFEQEAKG